jgi:hypothetical protein
VGLGQQNILFRVQRGRIRLGRHARRVRSNGARCIKDVDDARSLGNLAAIVLLLQCDVLVEVNLMIPFLVVRSRNSEGLLVHLCVEIEQTLGRPVNNQRQARGLGGVQ